MKGIIYIACVEKGCVTDEYIEIKYVGFFKDKAIDSIKDEKGCNLKYIDAWFNDEPISHVTYKY